MKGMNKVHVVRDVAKTEYHIPLNFVVSFLLSPVISGLRSFVMLFAQLCSDFSFVVTYVEFLC